MRVGTSLGLVYDMHPGVVYEELRVPEPETKLDVAVSDRHALTAHGRRCGLRSQRSGFGGKCGRPMQSPSPDRAFGNVSPRSRRKDFS